MQAQAVLHRHRGDDSCSLPLWECGLRKRQQPSSAVTWPGAWRRGAWRAAEPLWSSGPEAVGGPPPATSPDRALTCPSPADRKPPLSAALGEAEPPGPVDASELPKVQIPPPAHPAPVHQPPPLPHRPPPPPPSSYITGMSTSSSYMSGEGYQSLQSMMKTDGPSYGTLPPAYGPPAHLPYHPQCTFLHC